MQRDKVLHFAVGAVVASAASAASARAQRLLSPSFQAEAADQVAALTDRLAQMERPVLSDLAATEAAVVDATAPRRATAETTITQTEAFNEAADDPDAIGSWFDRLFPSSAAE